MAVSIYRKASLKENSHTHTRHNNPGCRRSNAPLEVASISPAGCAGQQQTVEHQPGVLKNMLFRVTKQALVKTNQKEN